ncbi:MAG TPA: hypothetical protein ENN67_06110, partial [Firmicutes bacterium]|nr:hypothetical protein [Bacillota bacterium]
MKKRQGWLCAMLLIASMSISACAGGTMPNAPDISNPLTDSSRPAASSGSGHVLWGLWDVIIDPSDGSVEIIPLREAAFNANVTMFMQPPMSPYNLLGITMNPATDFSTGYVDCNVTLQHPFKALAQFRGFDVRGIFLSDGSLAVQSVPGLLRAAPDDARLLNADGYTRWWNALEFGPEGKIFGFQMGAAGIKFYPTATVNPYKYFADALGQSELVENLNPSTRGTFSTSKGANTRNYLIQFPMSGGVPVFRFQYAIDASWDPPDQAFAPSYPIEAFNESAQMREAYHIKMQDDGSTAYWIDSNNFGGELKLAIEIFDWQTPPDGTSDQVSAIYLESSLLPAPVDVFPTAVENPGSNEVSRIYSVSVGNLTPSYAGEYEVFIAVESSVGTYEPNMDGGAPGFTFPDAPLVSYTIGSVMVGDDSPNNPPVAVADKTAPLNGYAPLTVKLNPEGSYDPDEPYGDYIALYEWDIDADGSYEYSNTDGEVIDHVFTDPGTYYIQLRVTDSYGAWDILDEPLEVDLIEGEDSWPMGFFDAQNTAYNPNSHVSFPLSLVYQTSPGPN